MKNLTKSGTDPCCYGSNEMGITGSAVMILGELISQFKGEKRVSIMVEPYYSEEK